MSQRGPKTGTNSPGERPGKRLPMRVNGSTLTPAQKAAQTRARKKAEQDALEKVNAQRLAQIVNLMIAGYSLTDIGNQIGATADEVDRLLQRDMSRYVRSQPALRVYVRNYLSSRYTELLDSVYDQATDRNGPNQLEYYDRALRTLKEMGDLHGAKAPVQTEVKVDAAPEAVEKMVQAISQAQGVGYDDSIFDVVDAEVVHDAVDEARDALEVSGNALAESDGDDEL